MLEQLAYEVPPLILPPVEVSADALFRSNLALGIFHLFQTTNCPVRVNANTRTTNVQNTIKSNQPAPTKPTNTSINLGSLPAATYVSFSSLRESIGFIFVARNRPLSNVCHWL